MFYVRSPAEGGQESIAKGLSVLWLVGLVFVAFLCNITLILIIYNYCVANELKA